MFVQRNQSVLVLSSLEPPRPEIDKQFARCPGPGPSSEAAFKDKATSLYTHSHTRSRVFCGAAYFISPHSPIRCAVVRPFRRFVSVSIRSRTTPGGSRTPSPTQNASNCFPTQPSVGPSAVPSQTGGWGSASAPLTPNN